MRRNRCSSWATRNSSSSQSSRVTRPSSRNAPLRVEPARSPTRMASPRQRAVDSSVHERTSSLLVPPCWARDSASSSARSAVSVTAPTSASSSRLTGSSMRARPPALAALFALCSCGGVCGSIRGRDGYEGRRGLLGGILLGLLERCLQAALAQDVALAPRVFRLALLEDREERRCDEDRRVSTGSDT